MKQILIIILLFAIGQIGFSQIVIPIDTANGVYKIDCKVNGVPMVFIFDTGASDVAISLTEAMFLIKNGFLKEEDIKGKVKYSIANGKIEEGTRIIIKQIQIGELVIKNIEASVIHNLDAPLLLGLSAISKLGKVSIENNNLLIYDKNEKEKIEIKYDLIPTDFNYNLQQTFKVLFHSLKSNNKTEFIQGNFEPFQFICPITDTVDNKRANRELILKNNIDSVAKKYKSTEKIRNGIKSIEFEYLYTLGLISGIDWAALDTTHFDVLYDRHCNCINISILIDDRPFIVRSNYNLDSNVYSICMPFKINSLQYIDYTNNLDSLENLYYQKKIMYEQIVEYAEWKYPLLSDFDKKIIDNFGSYRLSAIYNSQAYFLMEDEKYSRAIIYLSKSIELSSDGNRNDLNRSISYRGRCKYSLEDYRGAILDYTKIDLKYKYGTDYYFQGLSYHNLGNANEALLNYNRAIELEPNFCWTYLNRGNLKFFVLKNKKGACLDWSKAGELGCEDAYDQIKENCK